MKLLSIIVIGVFGMVGALLTTSSLSGQKNIKKPAGGVSEEQKVRLENLIARTRTASPEVAGDVFLTLISGNTIASKNKKIALLEEVFQFAKQSREPVRRKNWGKLVDTRNGFKQMAYKMGLDQLSLKSRVTQSMVSLDRIRARNLFAEIKLPALEVLTCEDALGYDLSAYYDAMWVIANQGFSAEEKKAGLHFQFILEHIAKVTTLAQLSPILKIIAEDKLQPDELNTLVSSVVRMLNRVSRDPRSFAFAVERESVIRHFNRLLARLKENSLPVSESESAIKSFLTKGFTEPVCSDVSWLKNGKAVMPEAVAALNKVLAVPLTEDDIQPVEIKGRAKDVTYWQAADTKQLLTNIKALRFGNGSVELTIEQRQSEEWQQNLAGFLDLLHTWESPKESAEDDYFQQKSLIYEALLDVCPEKIPLHNKILYAYAKYLKETNRHHKGSIGWLWHAKNYLRIVSRKNNTEYSLHWNTWRESGDDMLWLYGELSSLLAGK